MCGIACFFGTNNVEGEAFAERANITMRHRGPDDSGVYTGEGVVMAHRRLSILELSNAGHQPLYSQDARYVIIFNGEIYNHLELRQRYLSSHTFRGHSDTETIIELFVQLKEKMLNEMVGMWALIIWDTQTKQAFISRDRYGQKPLYIRKKVDSLQLASEIKVLIGKGEPLEYDPTAVVEFLALGNYGHLGAHSFFKDVKEFPQGCYAWAQGGQILDTKPYWQLPRIREKDKVPFDDGTSKELHNRIVEGVLSQTLSDVPIGLTLSGGIDSSIIAGILDAHYNDKVHIFTAQSPESKQDETKYVNAVLGRFKSKKFELHSYNLNTLSIKDEIEKYILIQEEPFGDPSILAHGFLMQMAAKADVKVILNGQGADELFFGYNNMAQAILLKQLRSGNLSSYYENMKIMNLGSKFFVRSILQSLFPEIEYRLRQRSRGNKSSIVNADIAAGADDSVIKLYKYANIHDVWSESIYGVHLPHLVHYDDRNGMAYSVEGRMPFLDHRIADYVATIKPQGFLQKGLRKYFLREACKQYLPDMIYNRTDKIGFYTPLIDAIYKDGEWIIQKMHGGGWLVDSHLALLKQKIRSKSLGYNDALHIWRNLSVNIWAEKFNIINK